MAASAPSWTRRQLAPARRGGQRHLQDLTNGRAAWAAETQDDHTERHQARSRRAQAAPAAKLQRPETSPSPRPGSCSRETRVGPSRTPCSTQARLRNGLPRGTRRTAANPPSAPLSTPVERSAPLRRLKISTGAASRRRQTRVRDPACPCGKQLRRPTSTELLPRIPAPTPASATSPRIAFLGHARRAPTRGAPRNLPSAEPVSRDVY
jgi:hypothetical protein